MKKTINDYIIDKIANDKQIRLNNTDREILSYLLEANEQKLTISNLADQLYISTSVISRFAKKLNCDGYTQLRYYVNSEFQEFQKHSLSSETASSNNEIITRIISNLEKMDTIEFAENISELADIIKTSSKIGIYGLGFSHLDADYLFYKLNILGIDASILNFDMPRGVIESKIQHCDTLIIFSRSAKTNYLKAKIELIQGKTIVLITANTKNQWSIKPDLIITIPGLDSSLDYSKSITGYSVLTSAMMDLLLTNLTQ